MNHDPEKWTTPNEMHSILAAADDIDPHETTVDEVEDLLDEMVEAGIWETDGEGKYRALEVPAMDFVSQNAPVDRRN